MGVVAPPLALAFAVTTGLGVNAGLMTTIVAGLVAAIFGGSNVQVSGATGAMTVVLVPTVHRHGRARSTSCASSQAPCSSWVPSPGWGGSSCTSPGR